MRPCDPVRVLIVDDEPLARDFVRGVLEEVPDAVVVGECGSGAAAVDAIRDTPPDVVFLDIQMPVLDGFGVIEQIGLDAMPEIVFVTAHEQNALRAFEVHALDYVVKPCIPERIIAAFEQARRRLRAGEDPRQPGVERLLRSMHEHAVASWRPPPGRVAVREGDAIRFVAIDDILWVEADAGEVILHCTASSHRLRTPLHGVLERLGAGRFVRIHRSAAVNVERIVEVRPWGYGDYAAVLVDGETLRVSRTYKDELLGLIL